MLPYRPEGYYTNTPTLEALRRGAGNGEIFQAICTKCDEFHNLHVDLCGIKGVIPREEAAIGIAEGTANEFTILSRVGKPICFQVLGFDSNETVILSRRAVQSDARNFFLNTLRPGDVIPAVVQNTTPYGVFCDIGCGYIAMMRVDRCCVSRLQDCGELFHPGQNICCAILKTDDRTGRIELSGRELLGTWSENASCFAQGQTVAGTVRSIMPYGIFVELAPNLSGLAEPQEGLSAGDRVSVYIRSIQHARHKIKLNILQQLQPTASAPNFRYFISSGHITQWEYYPGSRNFKLF